MPVNATAAACLIRDSQWCIPFCSASQKCRAANDRSSPLWRRVRERIFPDLIVSPLLPPFRSPAQRYNPMGNHATMRMLNSKWMYLLIETARRLESMRTTIALLPESCCILQWTGAAGAQKDWESRFYKPCKSLTYEQWQDYPKSCTA